MMRKYDMQYGGIGTIVGTPNVNDGNIEFHYIVTGDPDKKLVKVINFVTGISTKINKSELEMSSAPVGGRYLTYDQEGMCKGETVYIFPSKIPFTITKINPAEELVNLENKEYGIELIHVHLSYLNYKEKKRK